MFDTHYDLLTIAYNSYIKDDYSYLDKISKYFNDNNVRGAIANLYFMSREEMANELHPNYYSDSVSVLDMFIKAKEILDSYLPNTELLYSIEGADYISGEEELEKLYDAGLDSLILCWNTESKYASGNRSKKGLTEDGKKLLQKAIDLGIGIDLSHANENSFNDMIDLIKENQNEGRDVNVYASHSNVRVLCSRDRNLWDYQLEKIKDVDGLVGVFSNKSFVVDNSMDEDSVNARNLYMFHINYVRNIVGDDNVVVATDDMGFCADYDPSYGTRKIYDYETIGSSLSKDLVDTFGVDSAYKIIYGNAKDRIFNSLKNRREKGRGVK